MSEDVNFVATVDATNLNCPLPLLKAKQGLKPLASGECLKVVATDPGSMRDFQVFADLSGNALVSAEEADKVYTYVIRKA
jgi:TusA-related sulfurtransferase